MIAVIMLNWKEQDSQPLRWWLHRGAVEEMDYLQNLSLTWLS